MTRLVIATRNAGKLREISRLLDEIHIQAVGLDSFPAAPEVIEDGATFCANAEKKALEIAAFTGSLTLADDSGLEVAILNGAPGVHSARYAGPDASDDDNNRKLLEALAGVEEGHRQAAFRCCMVLALPGRVLGCFTGRLDGRILASGRGGEGFGYDPLFLVPDYGKTLAELSIAVKNNISHRGAALRQVVDYLRQAPSPEPRVNAG